MAPSRVLAAASLEPISCANHDQVRVLSTVEYKPAAQALAEAFAKDQVARYFIDTPDTTGWSEKQKWDLHLLAMEYVTYIHCIDGLVTTIGPGYDCVALWIPPNTSFNNLTTKLVFPFWRWYLYYKLSPIGRYRWFREFAPLMHDTKVETLGKEQSENCWYLVYLGTKPPARGKGYGKALIRHGTDRADKDGVPCYLESSNVVNLRLYQAMGFELCKQVWMGPRGKHGVPLDIMVRPTLCKSSSVSSATDSAIDMSLDKDNESALSVGGSVTEYVENGAETAGVDTKVPDVKLLCANPPVAIDPKAGLASGTVSLVNGFKTVPVVTTEEKAVTPADCGIGT